MDTALSPTTSRAVSVLAYSWMVAKQFVFIGLVCPAFALAMFLGFSSGWSFTEAARWLVEEQAAAQQIGIWGAMEPKPNVGPPRTSS